MSVSPSIQAIICEEVFDESSHPSIEEINEYASKIGIDPKNEPHLLHLAKEGLMQALPPPWKPCYDEKSKSYYYYNGQTGKTQWEHPLDNVYRSMVVKVRSGSQASFDEDSKAIEENTYTKEDLQSFEESLPKPPAFSKPILSPITKLETLNLGARKKDVKLSPVKLKSKSMQDFAQKSNEFQLDSTIFGKRKGSHANIHDDLDLGSDKNTESNKSLLLKNDKHPNTIEKGELTLSGGGSMFLKSNTKKLVQQAKSDNSSNDIKSIDSEQLPKSILRDRSLPEAFPLKDTIKDTTDKKPEVDDDRKIVRFNLVTQDVDVDYTLSDSEHKSTSEDDVDGFIKSKLATGTVTKSRFTISPVFDDEYKNRMTIKNESLFDKIDNADKFEENASRNSSLKLIKPNPTDFITPKLITKSHDLIPTAEQDDESVPKFTAKYPKEDLIIIEKSNIEDSIPEEDKSFEATSEKRDESITNLQHKITTEMEEKLDSYKKRLEKANEEKIEEYETILSENKQRAMEKLKNDMQQSQDDEISTVKQQHELHVKIELKKLEEDMENKLEEAMKAEQLAFQDKLNASKLDIEKNYEKQLEVVENTFKDKEKEIENNFQTSLKQTEADFLLKLEERIKEISLAHKAVIDRMKDDHNITLEELLRDFKSEEEILRREHLQNLADLKDKLLQEVEVEKQRMRESGEDRLYEKIRCEKRLLEDKYRCLKEKYLRLKADVKISLERRNHRREQSLTTTGSDTERSLSHKKGTSDRNHVNIHDSKTKNAEHHIGTPKHLPKPNKADINSNRSKGENKNIRQIIEDLDTSMSDRSSKRNDNDKKEKDIDSSDGNINPGRSRRKLFTRLKSSSTSRLNNNSSKNKEAKRSCSPVENLRRQLQKLEDLEDQFPQTAQSDTYHLRYPFSDAADIGGSSELEFFRHRIHLERDSVRRAKENLRAQKINFQKRQRELKLKHNSATRTTLHQLYKEERELSDMEVSLHRTRSLLGEKVIRLRHLEQSLQRMSSIPSRQEDATLSDISSHSASSGISSTEFATATDVLGNGKTVHFREEHFQESSEIIQSLENLNSEIREIWDVLNKQQNAAKVTAVLPQVPLVYSDQIWPVAANISVPTLNAIPTLADRLNEYHQRAALATTHGVQSIVVTQPPRAAQGAAVTTTLVERTKNLRDWLKQAKVEQGENISPGQATL